MGAVGGCAASGNDSHRSVAQTAAFFAGKGIKSQRQNQEASTALPRCTIMPLVSQTNPRASTSITSPVSPFQMNSSRLLLHRPP